MRLPRCIDMIDHTGKGRRFSASRGACNKNKALLSVGKLYDTLGDPEVVRIRYIEIDDTDNGGERASLFIGRDTESRDASQSKGEIVVTGLVDPVHAPVSG